MMIKMTAAALLALFVAACATAPQPAPSAPQGRGMDAKTQLETGRR